MRPVRLTNVNGTTPWVVIDTHSHGLASVYLTGAGRIEYTLENPFEHNPEPSGRPMTIVDGAGSCPAGTRAVRGVGLSPPDVLIVSQQGIP